MTKKDPRIDAYIAKSPDFAKPVLAHLRKVVRAACPEVAETVKWGFPNFDYKGIMCSMAAFKEHCTFGFWKGQLIVDKKTRQTLGIEAMGNFGRIRGLGDLPPDKVIADYVKQAMKLNDEHVPAPHMKSRKVRKPLPMPPFLKAALARDKKALAAFEAFPPSHKREYIEWLTGAKTDATREKRLATALEWIAEGKGRNWKYVK
jgi:hypothetical protein